MNERIPGSREPLRTEEVEMPAKTVRIVAQAELPYYRKAARDLAGLPIEYKNIGTGVIGFEGGFVQVDPDSVAITLRGFSEHVRFFDEYIDNLMKHGMEPEEI